MSVLSSIAQKASQKLGKSASREVAATAGKAAAKEVAATTGKKAAQTIGKEVAATSGKQAGQVLAKDVLVKGANPAFDGAMAAVKEAIEAKGRSANLSTPLLNALGFATTTEEALTVTKLARKLAVGFNKENRIAVKAGLETAASKARVHEEALQTLVQAVKTREEAYALFGLGAQNKMVEGVVDRYLRVGGAEIEELATKAVKLVPSRFDQRSQKATIKAVTLLETIEEQVRTLANYLNKALN